MNGRVESALGHIGRHGRCMSRENDTLGTTSVALFGLHGVGVDSRVFGVAFSYF